MGLKRTRNRNKPFAKILLTFFGIIILLVVVLVLIISPLTKYLIEKYDEKYTGRQITLGRAYVNPFTGYIHLSNLKIYESDSLPGLTVSDSIFFSAKGVSVNIAMLKLLAKTYEISELKLDQPVGKIIQNKKDFNFNDLVTKFSSEKNDTIRSPIHFNILNIDIVNGEFYYHDKLIPIKYFIREVNIDSKGKRWDSDTIATNFSFYSGTGSGSIKGNFAFNLKSKDYNIDILANEFELDLLNQYFKDISNYGTLRANIDADFSSEGNLNDPDAVINKGLLVINDFHLAKNYDDDYASFSKLVIRIKEMSPKKFIYSYDSIIVTQPRIKYEKYDYLDNFQMMFGKDWVKITQAQADNTRFNLILKIVDVIKALRKNLPKSDYEFSKVVIDKGIFEFNDYSISEKFSVEANPLYIAADSIYKIRNRVKIYLKSGAHPYGNISGSVSISPKESSNFELEYQLRDFPVSMFNPYIISSTSFPLNRGTLELTGKWKVQNGDINSSNHLIVIDPRIGKRITNEETDWLPMPLIMFMLRDKGNVIDFEIPITGNLKDPKFHWRDVVTDVLRNIFIKPPTTPYRTLVRNTEIEIEKSLSIRWEMRQNLLLSRQKRFINLIVDDLKENPKSSIDIYPIIYAEKEMENISFFEAKKKYFLLSKSTSDKTLSRTDSLSVNKMSVKDSLFIQYLNKQVNDNMLFTIQDKCNTLVGVDRIKTQLKHLSSEREDAFMFLFKKEGVDNRVTIHAAENTTPYNGFSEYRIVYNGELPSRLMEAYQKMEGLNSDAPRKKYQKRRDKIEGN